MAEEENLNNEEPKPDGAKKDKQPHFSKLGLIIFVAVLVLWTVLMYLFFSSAKQSMGNFEDAKEEASDERYRDISFQIVNAPEVKLEDVMHYVKINPTGSQGRILSCTLVLKLGLTEEEKRKLNPDNVQLKEDFNLKALLQLDNSEKSYKAIVEKMKDKLKSYLINEINEYNFQELNSSVIKQKIANEIKGYANDSLKKYGMEPRISEAYWSVFTFSP